MTTCATDVWRWLATNLVGCFRGTDPLTVFTVRLHVMQRTVLPRPFCLSVCPTDKRVHRERRKKLVPTFLLRMKDHSS